MSTWFPVSYTYVPHLTLTLRLSNDFINSTTTVRTQLRHDWRSEEQLANQNITEKMTRIVCMSSTRWISKSASLRGCPRANQGLPPPVSTSGDRCLQDLGSVETIQNRCVAFPNIYQHQVQPFRLKDSAKSGVRKIFVALLVDPTYTIPSATTVPPQQREII